MEYDKDLRTLDRDPTEGRGSLGGPEKKDSKKKKKKQASEPFDLAPLTDDVSKAAKELPKPPLLRLGNLLDGLPGAKPESGHDDDTHREPETLEEGPELPQNPEDVSGGEARLFVEHYAELRADQLEEELEAVESGSPEEAGVQANLILVDMLSERAAAEEPMDTQALDDTLAELLGDLDLAAAEPDTYEMPEDEDDVPDPHLATVNSPNTPPPRRGSPTGGAGPPTGPAPPSPPTPPVPPAGPGPTAGGGGRTMYHGAGAPHTNFNVVHHHAAASTAPEALQTQHSRALDLLLGGFIGYLIARRRWRNKMTRKFEPIERALQKKIKDQQEDIAVRERKIRALTAEKIEREGEAGRIRVSRMFEKKIIPKKDQKPKPANRIVPLVTPGPEQLQPPERRTEQAGRKPTSAEVPAPEIQESLAGAPGVEAAVATALAAVEVARRPMQQWESQLKRVMVSPSESDPLPPSPTTKTIRYLSDPELMRVARRIETRGTNVKTLYKQGRLEKKDLRPIVEAYVGGSTHVERVITEKLGRTKAPESAESAPERLSGQAKRPATTASGGGPVVSAARPQSQNEPVPPHAQAAAEALMAQQTAKERAAQPDKLAWAVAAAGLAVFFALGFILF